MCIGAKAQLTMSATTKAAWAQLTPLSENFQQVKPSDYAALPVYALRGGTYVSLMGKVNEAPQWNALQSAGVLRGSTVGNIATIKVPLSTFSQIDFSAVFSYIEVPGKIAPDLEKMRVDVHADSVQAGINLPEAFTGKDVLIGVTDWGFDYTQPMFYDTLLQQTRIVAAWDQYKQAGNQPANFPYGAEYTTVPELLAAQSDTANIYSYATHGTHVAGIAGGSGAGAPYRGMAPEAGFLFATFFVDAASVIDAYTWMKDKAEFENKRLVINMSWGLYYIGNLDGTSLLSQAIDALSAQGVVFVSSGGNNGDNNFHIQKDFDNNTMTTRVMFDSYTNPTMWGESITMWGEAGNSFDVKVQVYNGINTLLAESPLFSTSTTTQYVDSILVINTDTIYYNLTAENANPQNSRPHMRLRIKNINTNLKIVLQAAADTGTVHFWNLVELTNGVGNWGLSFVSFGTSGMSGNAINSIGEPACTASVIAVGAYSSGYLSSGGNPLGGTLASFSSSGPLITGVMKPDISAPGVNVISSMSSFTDASYSTFETVTFNGTDYDFAKLSGTSMSSPCVAGIVALMLDANPALTPAQIKTILQATAREDANTGDIVPPGHPRWGYGKVNAYAAVVMALQMVGVDESNLDKTEVIIYPNPTNDNVYVFGIAEHETIVVTAISMDGKRTNLSVENHKVNCAALAAGVYVLEVNANSSVVYVRMVKQ